MKFIILTAFTIAALGAGYLLMVPTTPMSVTSVSDPKPGALVAVELPSTLSLDAQRGKAVYEVNCAACHGPNGAGRAEQGPPLVHVIYESSHHGDEAFQRAVAEGVRGHHWPFGNMPPIKGLSRADVSLIIAYIRELQRANGID